MARLPVLRVGLFRRLAVPQSRRYSAKPPSSKAAASRSRIERLNSRLPRFLHRYTTPLLTAPVSHITAFLLLHELTAVVPLLGLAATFHYTNWLPPFFSEGAWVREGVERFGKYFRRKGWLKSLDDEGAGKRDKTWSFGEGGVRIVVEFATAYAITKALLPLRLILSVWATPWFARISVIPFTNVVRRIFRRGRANVNPASGTGAAAGTGAIDAGAVPKAGVGVKGKGDQGYGSK